MAQAPSVRTVADPDERAALCRTILSDLPEWFGRPDAVERYADDARHLTTFSIGATSDGAALGFACLCAATSDAFDLHVIGVRGDTQRSGLGQALVEACAAHARERSARYLTVRTIGPSRDDPNYAATRAFYVACGFVGVAEFADHWGRGMPMLLMLRSLAT